MEINLLLYSAMRRTLSDEECLIVLDGIFQCLRNNQCPEDLTEQEKAFYEPMLEEALERASAFTKKMSNLKQNQQKKQGPF